MDVNQRPERKKTLPLKLQDPKENITSGSKRPAKSLKMEIDHKPEEKKIKIHKSVHEVKIAKPPDASLQTSSSGII